MIRLPKDISSLDRQRLLDSPQEVLHELGLPVFGEVRVVANTTERVHLVLPPAPNVAEWELGDLVKPHEASESP